MSSINISKLTNMQNYRTKDLANLAIAAISVPPESPEDRVLQWSLRNSTFEDTSSTKMSTPTPVSRKDREAMTVPLGTAVTWSNLDSFLDATQPESISTFQDLGDIMHQGADDGSGGSNNQTTVLHKDQGVPGEDTLFQYPTIPPDPALHTAPTKSEPEGKRRVLSAGKDEWADSSDEEVVTRVSGKGSYTSEYFRPTATDNIEGNPRKKGKSTRNHRDSRFHSISGPKPTGVKSLSMSKGAVDYRIRKEIAKDYKEKVCALIDQDILERVDSEAGITPEGRMYKAVFQMMERGQRQGGRKQVVTPPNSSPESVDEVARLRRENQALRRRIQEASKVLGSG